VGSILTGIIRLGEIHPSRGVLLSRHCHTGRQPCRTDSDRLSVSEMALVQPDGPVTVPASSAAIC
jgi:hypothetical protein